MSKNEEDWEEKIKGEETEQEEKVKTYMIVT